MAFGWGPAVATAERFLVAAAVLSLLAAESERAPVLVLVDDLQWVDRESAAALGFAARRLRDDPVCFLWAARSGSIPPQFVEGMPVLTLAGLSPTDAAGPGTGTAGGRSRRAPGRRHRRQPARDLGDRSAPHRCPARGCRAAAAGAAGG